MTTTLNPDRIALGLDTEPPARPAVWRTGLAAAVAAAAATTVVAAGARAAGASLEAHGKAFPLAGFAQLTLLFSVVGILIARTVGRRASRPQSMFVRITVAL